MKETLKTLLLKGIKDEFLELLDLMGIGDVFQLPYDNVYELCIRYSRGISKTSNNSQRFSSQLFKSTKRIGFTGSSLNSKLDDL